jgi:hypothetical protein
LKKKDWVESKVKQTRVNGIVKIGPMHLLKISTPLSVGKASVNFIAGIIPYSTTPRRERIRAMVLREGYGRIPMDVVPWSMALASWGTSRFSD